MHSIVIPAYNEEKRIERTLRKYTQTFGKGYEFITICDGTDKTGNIVKELSKKDKRIRPLILEYHLKGKGESVYKGFDLSKGKTVGFTDADCSVKPKEYKKLIEGLKYCDCVVASRRVDGAKIVMNRPWHIQFASFVFNKIVNFLFGLGIKDTQCGAKVMKKHVYEKIKKDLTLMGFEFDVELLWRIKKSGFSILEVPIVWLHDVRSKTKISNHPNLLYKILKLRLFG